MENKLKQANKELGTHYSDWDDISIYQKLSEDFIERHKNNFNWHYISIYQKLSEVFIEKHSDKVNWHYISRYQKLSEDFIERHADKVNWNYISIYQKLSEDFIERHADKVHWHYISEYQKLSEDFIEKHKDKVDWYCISMCQKLSEDFINKYSDKLVHDIIRVSWLYKSTEEKKAAVISTGLYECHEDYFIAYKGIRSDRYSNYNFQYRYLPGETYESHCDFSSAENSFGLSVWTEKAATDYCNELVIKVKVRYEDVGRLVHDNGKIRCTRITILT